MYRYHEPAFRVTKLVEVRLLTTDHDTVCLHVAAREADGHIGEQIAVL
jgi:hypothetical protein